MKNLKDLQQLSEAELLKLVAEEQNSRALEVLMVQYRTFLKLIVHSILKNPFFEDDAIQEIWIKVHRLLLKHGYKEESHFPNWLGRIARCYCLDQLRKNTGKEFVGLFDEEGNDYILDESTSAEDRLMQKDEVRVLLGMLSPKHRSIVIKRYLEEKSPEETALEMDMTETAVNAALSRALQILRKKGGRR